MGDAWLSVEGNKARWSAQIFRRGQKKELFGDNDDDEGSEIDELKGKLKDLLSVWQLPRGGKDFSAAIWRPEHGCAEVVLQKGKLFSHMGFTWGRKLYLHAEEALYLVDRANLMLFEDQKGGKKRLLSLQESQELMLGAQVPMEHYLVYCKLMRAGYIVARYPGKWVLKPSESPRDIWGNEDNQIGSDSSMESMREQKRMRLSSFDPSAPPNQRNTGSNEDKHKGDDRFWHTSSACWLKNALPQFDELPRCSVEESFEDPLCYPNLHPLDEMQMTNDQHDFRSPKDGLHFCIYPASSHFSRKDPGKPKFIISVYPGEKSPSLAYLQEANAMSSEVPIRYVSVENGDIAIYAMARAQLPPINQMWRLLGPRPNLQDQVK